MSGKTMIEIYVWFMVYVFKQSDNPSEYLYRSILSELVNREGKAIIESGRVDHHSLRRQLSSTRDAKEALLKTYSARLKADPSFRNENVFGNGKSGRRQTVAEMVTSYERDLALNAISLDLVELHDAENSGELKPSEKEKKINQLKKDLEQKARDCAKTYDEELDEHIEPFFTNEE